MLEIWLISKNERNYRPATNLSKFQWHILSHSGGLTETLQGPLVFATTEIEVLSKFPPFLQPPNFSMNPIQLPSLGFP